MDILSSYNGSEVAGLINEALEDAGSDTTIGNESGSIVSGKLNEVFGDTLLDSAQSGDEWTQAVEEGFDGLEPQPDIDAVVKFLHVSDPHGSSTATTKAKNMLDNDADIAFLFVTGDVTAYGQSNGINSGISSDFTDIGDKLLLLAGNHDTYDNKFGTSATSQQATTNYIKGWLGQRVTYGDQSGVASYWHKDVPLGGSSKLRIISLDQYEIDKVRRSGNYYTIYSQAQVDWLIGLLKGLSKNDYVIIAMHEPPIQSPSGVNDSSSPDSYAVGLRPSQPYYTNGGLNEPMKLFVSEGLRAFGNRYNEPSLNLLPQIMDAYMRKQALSMTYNNRGGGSTPDITINEDFSSINPATFLFYLGGHRHTDICSYLPNEGENKDWSNQLMLYITCGDKGINYQYDDDLGGTGASWSPPSTPSNAYTYRINQVTLDFGAKTINVTRIGATNTAGGRVRDQITFPFKKGGSS